MKKLAIILMAMFLVLPLTASATTLTFSEFRSRDGDYQPVRRARGYIRPV